MSCRIGRSDDHPEPELVSTFPSLFSLFHLSNSEITTFKKTGDIHYDEDLLSIRIYAPGSDYPNSFEDIDTKSSMSMNLTSEESAYLIALAILYNQKFNEGEVEDDASVQVELEEFNTALASYLSFSANENKSIRDDSLRTLKKLKVIKFAKGVFEDEDRPLIIRPYIKQVILPDMLKPFLENEEMIVTDDIVTEVQTEEDINEDK